MSEAKIRTRKKVTEDDVRKINMLIVYGMKREQICELTGFSEETIRRFMAGTWEQYKEKYRTRERDKASKKKQEKLMIVEDQNAVKSIDNMDQTNFLLKQIADKLDILLDALGVNRIIA